MTGVGTFIEDLPVEPGDPWEWKVEVSSLELEHPEVVVSIDMRVSVGRSRVKEIKFSMTGLGDYDGTDLFRRLRLGSMHDGVNRFLRFGNFMHTSDVPYEPVDATEWRLALGRPGRAGHPERHYAEWVEKYLAAVEANPRRYMPASEKANPGYSDKTIRNFIKRAEELGLITDRPGHGKAGGRMTEKCRQLLEEN